MSIVVRKLMIDFLSQPNSQARAALQPTLTKASALKTQQLQQFIRQISHAVYQRQQNAHSQILVLKLMKELLITGSYSVYLLTNAFIFPWVVSICNFHKQQSVEKRAQNLFKDVTGRNATNGDGNLQSFRLFLIYAEQFLVFFGENYKFYPHSKYKIKNSFAKELQLHQFTRSLSQFTNVDLNNLQSNLRRRGTTFRDELSDFTDFLNAKIEQCMLDASKFHDNLYLLISLVEMSESFCISIIVLRLRSFLTLQHIEIACKTIDFIISTAQIQAVETINARCLPSILQYLIPADFKQNSVLELPKIVLDGSILHKLIDYYYIWHEKTKILKLSTKIYDYSLGMIEYLKKPFKLSFQNQLKGFLANLQKIQQSNEVKRAFIIDQHQQQEEQMVKLLKNVAFCVSSQRVQRKIAYSNVLDDLTITDQQSISEFGQSLLQSAKRRQNEELVSNKSNDSRWSKRLANSSKISSRKSKRMNNGEANERQQAQNVYYYKNGISPSFQYNQNNRHTSKQKAGSIMIRKEQLRPSQNKKPVPNDHYFSKQCQSYAEIQYPSFPKVTSKDSRGSKPHALSSSKSEISLHSSQFSQKDNNQHRFNKPIQSIYTSRSKPNQNGALQDKSGQFLYFEKESELKSQKHLQYLQGKSLSKSQVQFHDSLMNVNQSQSCQVLEFGMDINAKIPQTISKPKFNFKNGETYDTELVMKNRQSKKSQQVVSIQPLTHKQRNSPQTIKFDKKVTYESKASPIQTKNGFQSKVSKVKSVDSRYILTPKQDIFKKDFVVDESSGSMIKENAGHHLISQSISLSNQKVPSNFKEVFRQKSQKASVISSSRSLKRLRQIPERKVEIPDFKKLRNLQNQLGKLKKQTQKFNKQLVQKDEEMERLKKEKNQIIENDPYFLKKQNEIMKILLKNKEKGHPIKNSHSSAKNLNKELKESSIKNYNMSLKDYNNQTLKLKFQNIKSYTKDENKNIVGNRCILLKNDLIEIGYSFKNNEATLYLTLKNYCDSLEINLLQNSIIFSESIRRSFDKLYVGKQMKFKTEVKETKQNSKFIPAVVMVKLTYQHKLEEKNEEFNCQLPLTPYNMAIPLSQAEGTSQLSQSKSQMTNYVTPLYNSNEDLIKKGKSYLLNIFPHGYFSQDGSTLTVNYKWKGRVQIVNIKLKERAFRIEGTGYPIQSGRELIETIINLIIE